MTGSTLSSEQEVLFRGLAQRRSNSHERRAEASSRFRRGCARDIFSIWSSTDASGAPKMLRVYQASRPGGIYCGVGDGEMPSGYGGGLMKTKKKRQPRSLPSSADGIRFTLTAGRKKRNKIDNKDQGWHTVNKSKTVLVVLNI